MTITPLSKRLDGVVNSLSYPKTTKEFKNQIIAAVMQQINSTSGCHRDEVTEYIVAEYYKSTGKGEFSPSVCYTASKLQSIMSSLTDADFIDLLDIIIQLSPESEDDYDSDDDEFISDLNEIMKMNGMDIQIVEKRIIRMSEPFMQEEVVNPAFKELYNRGFTNAHEALWKAFDFFKTGDNENAILSASKSLEATIDYILNERKINPGKDKIQNKLKALIDNSILPSRYETSFNSLINVLQTAPTIRNKYGGHGTSDESKIDDLYVKYAIDSAASAILFLSRLFVSVSR